MHVSYIMIDRFLQREASRNEEYRRKAGLNGKVYLADGRLLSDDELQERLADLGLEMDRERLDALTTEFPSAEEMSRAAEERFKLVLSERDQDWLWIGLTCLWQRWFPDRPCLETIDDTMQAGYDALESEQYFDAARAWNDTWGQVRALMRAFDVSTVAEFDERFPLTESLFNWVQDYVLEERSACRDDREWMRKRITLCEEVLGLVDEESEGDLFVENFRRDMAEAYFRCDEPETGERLFARWLADDPRWGWGWIGWSDCYYMIEDAEPDFLRGEELLLEGLAVPEVRDRDDLLMRLSQLYDDAGRPEDAERVHQELEALRKSEQRRTRPSLTVDLPVRGIPAPNFLDGPRSGGGDSYAPLEPVKAAGNERVGRNQPCPCGSGKKFKRCCLRAGRD